MVFNKEIHQSEKNPVFSLSKVHWKLDGLDTDSYLVKCDDGETTSTAGAHR